jgi:hypothetical protein
MQNYEFKGAASISYLKSVIKRTKNLNVHAYITVLSDLPRISLFKHFPILPRMCCTASYRRQEERGTLVASIITARSKHVLSSSSS